MEDSFIVDLYWRRDERAIAETERKYGGACEGIARRFLPAAEDAEEIVQDAYLSLWNTIPPQRPEHLGAYLFRTVRNAAFSRCRAASAQKRGGGEAAAALDELAAPSLEHPPRAMVPVDTTPAAMSNSTKRRRLMVFAGCWRCWVMGIPFCWGVTKRLAMRLCTWSRRILRLRNGVLLRRNWRACRLSGFLHRRCGLSRCVWRQVRPKAPWAPGRKGRI